MPLFSIYKQLITKHILLVCASIVYTISGYSQVVNLGCQTELVAVEDLERKNWNGGSTAIHSQGSMHNFTLPTNTFGDCKRISNISIEIDAIGVDLTNLPPDCIPTPVPYYYNIHTGCAPFIPASCPGMNLIGESNTPTFTDQSFSYNGDFDFGDNLAIDIVPVMNINCTAGQTALTSDAVILDYEICVTVTIIDETIDTPVDLGDDQTICPTSTFPLDAGTYSEYAWDPNGEIDQTINATAPGTYTVTVTDANGCTDTDQVVILALADSPITFNPIAPTVCDNGMVSVSVNESYPTYDWSNTLSGQTVSLSTGTYDVTITDSNNCTSSNSITVTSIPSPNAGDDDSDTVCDGDMYDLSLLLDVAADPGGVFSDPGGTASLSGSMVDVTGLGGTTVNFLYTVGLVSDPCGSDEATLTLIIEAPSIAGDDNSATVCNDITMYDLNGLLDVNAEVGGTFSDPGGAGALTGSTVNTTGLGGQTINYVYTVGLPTDACGVDEATLTLIVESVLTAGDDGSETVCDGDFYDLNDLLVNADVGGAFSETSGTSSLTGSNVNTLGLGGQTLTFIYEVGLPTDVCGTDQATLTLIIDPFLIAGDDNSITVCDGTPVNLNDLLDFNADFGGTFSDPAGTSSLTGSNVNTTGLAGQTIDFVYQVGDINNSCGIDEAILTVIIEASVEAGNNNSISVCEGSMVDLNDLLATNSSSGGVFSDPSGSSSLTGSMVNTTGLAGQIIDYIYTVGVAGDPCGNDEATLTISIETSLLAGDDNAIELCSGITVNLDTYLINADLGGTYFDINSCGGLSGNILTTSGIPEGLCIYQYVVGDGITCPFDTANISIQFNDIPEATFEIDTIELCYNICQEINITVTGASAFTYDLAVNDQDGFSQATTTLSSTTDAFSIHLCNDQSDIAFTNDTLNFSNSDSLLLSIQNIQGDICNSTTIDSLWITSLPPNVFQLDTSICIFDTLFIADLEFFVGNSTYIDTIPGIDCDSFININVTFDDIDTSYILETICSGDSTNYFSTWFDESNPYEEFSIATSSGCDSLVIVDISFYPMADSLINETLCEGDFIIVNGVTFNEANPTGQETLEDASSNGCDSLVTINLQFGGDINITRNDILCEGESIEIGGTVINESNNPTQITIPGTGCDTTFNINLNFVPPSTNNISGTFCNDFDTIVNGTLYDITNPTDTETIIGGNYLGCDSVIIIDLLFDNGPIIFRTDTLCEGNSITIGGTEIDESNNPTILIVSGTDCDTTFNINLTFAPPSTNNITGIFCSNFDTIVNGNLYNMSNPSDTEIISGGNYLGCDSLIVVDLQFDNGIVVMRTDTLCEGGSVMIGGSIFNESNSPGQLIVPGIDCDTTFNINLTFVLPTTNTISGVFCSDFDTLVNGNLYDMTNPSDTEIIAGGNYLGCDSLIVVDLSFISCDIDVNINSVGNNCGGDSLGLISVEILSNIPVPYLVVLEELSTGEMTTITVSTTQNIHEFSNLISGDYQINILDNLGAVLYTSTENLLDLFDPLNGSWNLIDTIICATDLAQLEFIPMGGSPNYNYTWNSTDLGNDSTIDLIPSGEYFVTVTDMNGCTTESSYTIVEPTPITMDIITSDVTCIGINNGMISIEDIQGGTLPYTILFNNVATTLALDSLAPGDYTIEIIDSNSCRSMIEQVTISGTSSTILADYTLIHDIILGDSISLTGDLFEDDLSFEWNPSTSLSCSDCPEPIASPSTTTNYELTITNLDGCEQIVSVIVNVSTNEVVLVTPNIFSPNGDGANDNFLINLENELVVVLELTIYDRWGNQMHNSTSTDGSVMWDGTKNGNQLLPGVYVYQLTIGYLDGSSETMVKDLTLIR